MPTAPPRRRARAAATPTARSTLTPDTWIAAATDVLVDEGVDRVRVDVLANQLEVTRGSFYWHFRDRQDLLQQVLQAWRAHTTEQLTARMAASDADPRVQLRHVLQLPRHGRAAVRAARIELAIRAWARHDPMARECVDASDAARMGYIAQLFSQLGHPVAEARHRAYLAYTFIVGDALVGAWGTPTEREGRAATVERLLAG